MKLLILLMVCPFHSFNLVGTPISCKLDCGGGTSVGAVTQSAGGASEPINLGDAGPARGPLSIQDVVANDDPMNPSRDSDSGEKELEPG